MTDPIKTIPVLPAGYTGRAACLEDASSIHAVFAAADLADGTSWAGSVEEYANELTRPDMNPQTDTRVILSSQGGIIAAAWFNENLDKHREHYASLYGVVHPDFCGQGIGTWLMVWLEGWVSARLTAYLDDLPCSLTLTSAEGLTARENLYRRFGYRPVGTYYKMRCKLNGDLEAPDLPEGLTFVPYSPALDSQVHTLMDTAFSEHRKYQPHTPELWARHTSRSPAFCLEASNIVFDGDVPAGASVCSIWAEDNARLGIKEGWVDMLGVLKEYRKRGIASALLLKTMQQFREMGLEYAGLFVDSENETGALALYERLGFRRVMSTIRWTKQIR